jgi:hypothetical protein
MGILDAFRPKYRHSDVKVRAEAVRAMTNDDAATLVQVAKTDRDPGVRRLAIERLDEAEILADIAHGEGERALKDLAGSRAVQIWSTLACAEDVEAAGVALNGILRLGDQRAVAEIAGRAETQAIRKRALAELREPRALADLAKSSAPHETRLEAVARIDDAQVLRALATDATTKEIGLAAVEKIDEPELLESVAQKAKTKAVRQRARKIVAEMREAERARQPQASDDTKRRRAEKSQLVRNLEPLVEGGDFALAAQAVENATAAFAGLGVDDPEIDGKLRKLVQRFRHRQDAHDKQMIAQQKQAEAEVAARAERARLEELRRIEREQREAENARRAEERAASEEARRIATAKKQAERAEQDAAKRQADGKVREEQQKDDEARTEQLRASLRAMLEEMEQVLASGDGRAIDRLLAQASKAFDQVGRLPQAERDELNDSYDQVRAKLVIRVRELREAEDWQRWANVAKQEALIKEAQLLAESTDEDPTAALKDLQSRWKQVGQVPQKRSQELWEQFKAACDRAYDKVREVRAANQEKFAEVAKVKEQLIARAEALADSSDWEATAAALKSLQQEWKESGHLPRKLGDELWKKFRAACDRFFERRKPLLDAAHEEQQRNLEAKQALCAKVEDLVASAPGSEGWGKALADAKICGRQWRDIGFVPRAEADSIYQRFRAACDALFARRDAARDVETEGRRAEIDAIRADIKAVMAGGDEPVERASAVKGRLRELLGREDERRGPGQELAELMEGMIHHLVATYPDDIIGTEFDPELLAAKHARLLDRARKLLPVSEASTESQSAEDVAQALRKALSANTFSEFRFAGKDPVEAVDDLRREWAEVGPDVGEDGERLRGEFAALCKRVLAQFSPGTPAPDPAEARSRTRPDRRPVTAPVAPVVPVVPTVISEDAAAEAAPVVPASPSPRARSMSQAPPLDDLDTSWDAESPPSAAELAGDGSTEGDSAEAD